MKFPSYPTYMRTRTQWLGEIPSHWTTQPLWSMFHREKMVGMPDEELLSVFRDYGVIPKSQRDNLNKTAENRDIYQFIDRGWLVTNRMKAWQGSVGISPQRGIVSGHYIVFRPIHQANDNFLNLLMRSDLYTLGYQTLSRGVRPGQAEIDNDQYRTMPVILPPIKEQDAIVKWVRSETAQIDKLIGKQNALIEILGERRKAVITRAVTKGLHPSVPMKKTGSKRLPQIPEAWTFPEIGWNTFVGNGSTPNRDTVDFWSEGAVPWLNSSHVNRDRVENSDQFVTEYARTACHLPMVAPESVLVGLTGEGKTRGMATVLGIPATINQHLAYLTPYGGRLRPQFLYWAIAASYTALRELSGENGSTKGGLTCSALKHFRIALPPSAEQDRICAHLAAATSQIDRTVALTREFVALATERRSALITAAVTGKIDVRGEA